MTNTFQLGASRKQTTVYHLYLRTHEEAHLFGDNNNGEVVINAVGQVVAAEWQQTACAFKDIHLDQWTVLPDGVRALVMVDSKE
ncbi:MAG: hypothetical protein AAFU71_06665, partial [Cyanobacteria bacterium J06632_22]